MLCAHLPSQNGEDTLGGVAIFVANEVGSIDATVTERFRSVGVIFEARQSEAKFEQIRCRLIWEASIFYSSSLSKLCACRLLP